VSSSIYGIWYSINGKKAFPCHIWIFINTRPTKIERLEFPIDEPSQPYVSVIIINFNGLRWLKLFMPYFVLTQYPNFEIIVIDNASKDESVKYLKDNFKQVKIVELKKNKGFAEGANVGTRVASGRILAFLNNDMEARPDWLTNAVLILNLDKSTAAVQCKIMQHMNKNRIDAVGLSVDRYGVVNMIGHDEEDSGQYDSLKEIGACSGGAMVVWKDIFLEVGGFDPLFFMYYEDVDLSWRIRLAGYKIGCATSSVVYHIGSASADVNSPFIGFHLVKNHLTCWLKNSRLRTISVYWPVVLVLMIGWSIYSLLNRRPLVALAQVKGIIWPLLHIKHVLKERLRINRLRKASSDEVLFVEGIVKGTTNISFAVKRYRDRINNRRPS
jgi:GT2 family glycosyltransferase